MAPASTGGAWRSRAKLGGAAFVWYCVVEQLTALGLALLMQFEALGERWSTRAVAKWAGAERLLPATGETAGPMTQTHASLWRRIWNPMFGVNIAVAEVAVTFAFPAILPVSLATLPLVRKLVPRRWRTTQNSGGAVPATPQQ